MNRISDRGQSGFSLIELLVAMTVTVIIAGSIVGLLAVGQTAFTTQPEQTERQQNLRIAMNAISEDVMQAGTGLPRDADIFETGRDHVGPTVGPSGQLTDELWMLRSTDCAAVKVCRVKNTTDLFTFEPILQDGCFNLPNLVFIVGNAPLTPTPPKVMVFATRFATWGGAAAPTDCPSLGSTQNGHLTFTQANGATINTANPFSPFDTADAVIGDSGYVVGAQRVAYRIAVAADGFPSLERGQLLKDLMMSWETIARGIDDLQVEYLQGDPYNSANRGVFAPEPVAVRAPRPAFKDKEADPTSVVRQVRVRLSARTISQRVQGGSISQQIEMVINPMQANTVVSMNNNES